MAENIPINPNFENPTPRLSYPQKVQKALYNLVPKPEANETESDKLQKCNDPKMPYYEKLQIINAQSHPLNSGGFNHGNNF